MAEACVAAYSFHAASPEEVSFTAGERLKVLNAPDGKLWWLVETATGSTGYAPVNYLGSSSTCRAQPSSGPGGVTASGRTSTATATRARTDSAAWSLSKFFGGKSRSSSAQSTTNTPIGAPATVTGHRAVPLGAAARARSTVNNAAQNGEQRAVEMVLKQKLDSGIITAEEFEILAVQIARPQVAVMQHEHQMGSSLMAETDETNIMIDHSYTQFASYRSELDSPIGSPSAPDNANPSAASTAPAPSTTERLRTQLAQERQVTQQLQKDIKSSEEKLASKYDGMVDALVADMRHKQEVAAAAIIAAERNRKTMAERERNAAVDKSKMLQKRVSQLEEVVLALSEAPKAPVPANASSSAVGPVNGAYAVPRKSAAAKSPPKTSVAGDGLKPNRSLNTAARKAAFSRHRQLPAAPAGDVPTLPPRNKRPAESATAAGSSALHTVSAVAALEGHALRDGYLVMDAADGQGAAVDTEAAAVGETIYTLPSRAAGGGEALYTLPSHRSAGGGQGRGDPIYATIASPAGHFADGVATSLLKPSERRAGTVAMATVSRVVQREDHEVVDAGCTAVPPAMSLEPAATPHLPGKLLPIHAPF